MKTCCVCGNEKPLSDFYETKKNSGRLMAACKLCINERNKKYRYGVGRQKTLEHDRKRDQDPARLAARLARLAKREEQYPERVRAKNMVNNALRAGKIVKWPVCWVHDCNGKPEAHHPDYSRPLEVVWLCHSHHMMVHNMVKNAA